jgi:hypothetical protein
MNVISNSISRLSILYRQIVYYSNNLAFGFSFVDRQLVYVQDYYEIEDTLGRARVREFGQVAFNLFAMKGNIWLRRNITSMYLY